MSENLSTSPAISEMHRLPWDAQHIQESLDTLYQFALDESKRAENWYWTNAGKKSRWARLFRMFAILATAIGGIFPVVSQIITDSQGVPVISPAWASVVLAIGGTCLALDRFYGFSSGWVRFMTTALNIQAWSKEFQFEWQQQRAMLQGQQPTLEQAQDMISRCAMFSTRISNAVSEETKQWVQEFQESLKALDQSLKEQSAASQPGVLKIAVSNGEQCADGWFIQVGARRAEKHFGKTGVIDGLLPGLYTVKLSGDINQKAVYAETAVQMRAGEILNVELTLD